MLKEFEYVVRGVMPLPDGRTYGFVSELTPLRKDILAIMDVPLKCFSYERLFETADPLKPSIPHQCDRAVAPANKKSLNSLFQRAECVFRLF